MVIDDTYEALDVDADQRFQVRELTFVWGKLHGLYNECIRDIQYCYFKVNSLIQV